MLDFRSRAGEREGMRLIALFVWGWLLSVAGLLGQESPPKPNSSKIEVRVARNLETLQHIGEVMREVERELQEARKKQAEAVTEDDQDALQGTIVSLLGRLETLQRDFGKVALGLEESAFDSVEEPAFDVGGEVEEVLKPLFRELNEATAGLRELDALRTQREVAWGRERMARGAVERLRELAGAAEQEELKGTLERMLKSWEGRVSQANSQVEALELQIEEREQQDHSIFQRVSQGVKLFCKTRGKNLLVAFFAAIGVYFFLRWFYRFVRKASPWHRKPANFWARLLDVGYSLFSVGVGILVAFLVLFLSGDWVLLVLGFLILLGVLWASKNTLPHVYEQTKLLLNLGPVREKERLIYEGIPWKVHSLGFYCEFINPELSGGELRLPLRTLVDLHSRPCDEKEPWFPTSLQDWVKMPDGTLGRVVVQTPEQVELVKLGGSRVFYRASSFLEASPENLSKNFRLSLVFGIDYDHQAKSTKEIPQVFYDRLYQELIGEVGAEGLMNLRVEFKQAAASSLDYEICADFSGELASRYNVLERMIARVCVEVCNEHDFVIPFTQVTVHQAT